MDIERAKLEHHSRFHSTANSGDPVFEAIVVGHLMTHQKLTQALTGMIHGDVQALFDDMVLSVVEPNRRARQTIKFDPFLNEEHRLALYAHEEEWKRVQEFSPKLTSEFTVIDLLDIMNRQALAGTEEDKQRFFDFLGKAFKTN